MELIYWYMTPWYGYGKQRIWKLIGNVSCSP